MLDFVDEVVLDGVAQHVSQLLPDGQVIHQVDDAGLLRRPEILETSAQTILMLGEERVKEMGEGGEITVVVDDDAVPVVRVGDESQYADVETFGGEAQTIQECVCGFLVGT